MAPTICVNIKKIKAHINQYRNYGLLFYPIKANPSKVILTNIIDDKMFFNVSSIKYLNLLIKNGVTGDRILWDNSLSTIREYKKVIKNGISFFVIDDLKQYKMLRKIIPNLKVLIRISNEIISNEGNWKYGTSHLNNIVEETKIDGSFEGFSMYLGKYFSYDNLVNLVQFVSKTKKFHFLDIGGGYEDIFNKKNIINFLMSKKNILYDEIIFEPGRALLNPASKMLTKVISIKTVNNKRWIRLDASIYSGLLDIYIERKKLDIKVNKMKNKNNEKLDLFYISGYTSDNADYLGKFMLPKNLKVGDILEIGNCGAYIVDINTNYSGAKKIKVGVY